MKENYVDKEILEKIKKLMGFACKADGKEEMEFPILVLAPSLGSSKPGEESKKLRVYAYGGLIGEIPTSQRQDASLASEDYLKPKYLPENPKKKEKLKKIFSDPKIKEKAWVLQTLFGNDYLELMVETCRNRFSTETGDLEERIIETNLVKKYLQNTDVWVPIDIEFMISRNWLDDAEKRGKPDIIIYDKRVNAFRLIELKCNEESCGGASGLSNHYLDAMNIINSSHRDKIIGEFFRKMQYLLDYGIISGEAWKEVLESTDRKTVDLKFGYFFIGGELETYKAYVKNQLDSDKNCSFLYSPDIDTDILKNCQMLSYDEFMRYK